MHLSPFAQYCIRKIFRQNLDELNQVFGEEATYHILAIDLDKILNYLYLDAAEVKVQVHELEVLTKIYTSLEKSSGDASTRTEIKRRIFDILGFKNNVPLPAQLPVILQEHSVDRLPFQYEGKVREGIQYQGETYGSVYTFDTTNRLQAYQSAWAFSEQNIPLIVTVSQHRYTIWVSVRSPAYGALLRQDPTLLKTVLALYATLRKCKYTTLRRGKGKKKI